MTHIKGLGTYMSNEIKTGKQNDGASTDAGLKSNADVKAAGKVSAGGVDSGSGVKGKIVKK